MSQAADVLTTGRTPYIRVVGAVSAAHFVSHYYIILLAPLMPFVRAEYGVSYTEIGLAFAAFNIVTAALQTPAGFLVDRLGARVLLIAGLMIGASAFVAVGLIDLFWVMVAMFAVAGIGNTVYHPADYALLSHHVPSDRIGQAFSIHTFAGMLGSAVAPATLLMMQSVWGWRGAFIGAGVLGFATAAIVLAVHDTSAMPANQTSARAGGGQDCHQLAAAAVGADPAQSGILCAARDDKRWNLQLFSRGPRRALRNPRYDRDCRIVRKSAVVGDRRTGWRPDSEPHLAPRHRGSDWTFRIGPVHGAGRPDQSRCVGLIAAMSLAGFFSGVIMPSRDMIVRDITPPGSFGKVFGFVTTGFNIGGIIAPLIFGWVMDHGSPRLVFLGVAALSLIAIVTVATRPRRPV